jgi:hypothetical protein
MSAPILSRRDWLKLSAAGVLGSCMSGWFEGVANAAAAFPARKKMSCILLWMNGGPSQLETFDVKTGHKNGGGHKEIATNVPGLKISENLPRLAKLGDRLAVIRSVTGKENDHPRAAYHMRTGYIGQGSIQYPTLGSLFSKELGRLDSALPNFVSIAPTPFFAPGAYGPGFLGPEYAPLMIANNGYGFGQPNADYANALKVQDLLPPKEVEEKQIESRLSLVREMQDDFASRRPGVSAASHRTAYARAVRLMRTDAKKAFNLEDEPARLRDAYGQNLFGQGCLLARRLVERGVPFVEVTLSNAPGAQQAWDTHIGNADQVAALCKVLDPAWSTLMADLKDRGLLDSTLVVWMGEFGRTPVINPQRGRDHWPNVYSAVLAGGGIKGGQAYGKTGVDGMAATENPVPVPNLIATIARALGLDHTKQNDSNVGRPIRIADAGSKPIKEVLA